jgi:hypothetical protein
MAAEITGVAGFACHIIRPLGFVNTRLLDVSSTFDPLGSGLFPLECQTMVLAGIMSNQMASKKRFELPS